MSFSNQSNSGFVPICQVAPCKFKSSGYAASLPESRAAISSSIAACASKFTVPRNPTSAATASNSRPQLDVRGELISRSIICKTTLNFRESISARNGNPSFFTSFP